MQNETIPTECRFFLTIKFWVFWIIAFVALTSVVAFVTGSDAFKNTPFEPLQGVLHGSGDPVRISIPTLDMDASVVNPIESDIKTLDEALLHGVVRHPESHRLGEAGITFLFGHSSRLPFVRNKNFTVFNNIEKLVSGDSIIVYSSSRAYTYRVSRVELVNADEGFISFEKIFGNELVLSTCNSFGSRQDRYVVYATLEKSKAIN